MKFILSCLFIFITFTSFSQDLIVKQDNSKIYCKIIKVDSLSIYYKQTTDKNALSINKTDVFKCFTSTNGLIFENKILSPIVAIEVKKDSIFIIKTDSIKRVKSIKFKRDSILSLNDSIFIKNKRFVYHGYPLKRNGVLKVMERNAEAHDEMQMAIGEHLVSNLFFILGSGLTSIFLAEIRPSIQPKWGLGVAGVILESLGFPLLFPYHKHTLKAIKIYNSKLGIATTKIPKFEFGMASRGLGVSLKF